MSKGDKINGLTKGSGNFRLFFLALYLVCIFVPFSKHKCEANKESLVEC